MSTHITGKLIRCGTYSDSKTPHGETELACAVVVMPKIVLRDVDTLPMYADVTIIPSDELAALKARAEKSP